MGSQEKEVTNQKKGGKVIFAVCLAIILILAAVIVVLLLKGKKDDNQPMRNVVVNEDNAADIAKEFVEQEPVRSGRYEVKMNSTWNFADGSSASDNAYVENVANNTNDVYFDINLSETDELIYSSPVIPLGSHLENITLDKDLDAGSYDCVLTYHLVDENQKTLSTLRVALTIEVQN